VPFHRRWPAESYSRWFRRALQVFTGFRKIEGRGPFFGHRIEDRKIELRLFRVEVDEKIVNLVENFLRTRVGAINFMMTTMGLSLASTALAST